MSRTEEQATQGGESPHADAVFHAYGLTCGSLEPAIRDHLKALPPGQILEVRSDEPAAREGVPAWSRLTRYELLATVREDQGRTRFYLRAK